MNDRKKDIIIVAVVAFIIWIFLRQKTVMYTPIIIREVPNDYKGDVSTEQIKFRVRRVSTFAEMESLLRANESQMFTVANDEELGVEKVQYLWDGVELFVYGTIVEPQPTL